MNAFSMNAFCLVCTRFQNAHWHLGTCLEKGFKIHKPFRNCAKYYPSPNVTDDPFPILQWYKNNLDLAQVKLDYVKLFFEKLDIEKMKVDADQDPEGEEET